MPGNQSQVEWLDTGHDSSTKTGSYETTRSEIGDRHHAFGVVCRSSTTARAPRGSRWLRILKHHTTRCRATRRRTTSNARIRDENYLINVRVRANGVRSAVVDGYTRKKLHFTSCKFDYAAYITCTARAISGNVDDEVEFFCYGFLSTQIA